MPNTYKTDQLDAANPVHLQQAVAFLQSGEAVALPTETVYGLAADATNSTAIQRVFEAKIRPLDHPLILHIADVSDLSKWVIAIPDSALVLANAFWPGPLTMVLKKSPAVLKEVTGGLDTVAVRVPRHAAFQAVLQSGRLAVVAPSANLHKRLSPTTADHVRNQLQGRIAAVLDGGPCDVGVESTIIDLTGDHPRVLRPGGITQRMLESVLSQHVAMPRQHHEKVSGNMTAHYQPETPLRLVSAEQCRQQMPKAKKRIALVHLNLKSLESDVPIAQQLPCDASGYAKALYAVLHELDAADIDEIWLELPPDTPDWQGVHDRLKRAENY